MTIVFVALFMTGCKQDLGQLEVGDPAALKKVLFAGESSPFKQKVLSETIDILGKDGHYFKLIGLNDLQKEDISAYKAVVIINTLMIGKTDARMDSFMKDHQNDKKVIIFTTAGSPEYENWKPSYNVDAITSASAEPIARKKAEELAEMIRNRT